MGYYCSPEQAGIEDKRSEQHAKGEQKTLFLQFEDKNRCQAITWQYSCYCGWHKKIPSGFSYEGKKRDRRAKYLIGKKKMGALLDKKIKK